MQICLLINERRNILLVRMLRIIEKDRKCGVSKYGDREERGKDRETGRERESDFGVNQAFI